MMREASSGGPDDPSSGSRTSRDGRPSWQQRPALLGSLAFAWLLTWARHRLVIVGPVSPELWWSVAALHAALAGASAGVAAALIWRRRSGLLAVAAIGVAYLLLGFFILDLFSIPGQPAETIVLSLAHRLVGLHLAIAGWQGFRSERRHV
jgi:hypothetical protein